MKELLQKLSNAKLEIKETKLQKGGWNDYSKYAYFTPDQIEFLVSQACKNNKLLTTFDLIRNELGIYGELTIYDIESANELILKMATDIPQIKATNTAQQLGGCVTYTERYLKMSAFGITDNQLDFDVTPQGKKPPAPTKEEKWTNFLDNEKKIFEEQTFSFENAVIDLGYDMKGIYAVTDEDIKADIYNKLTAIFNELKGK